MEEKTVPLFVIRIKKLAIYESAKNWYDLNSIQTIPMEGRGMSLSKFFGIFIIFVLAITSCAPQKEVQVPTKI
jgi:hypothetical protein